MRPIERIPAILKLIEEAWLKNPDMRLWQLLECANVNWNTEDLTTLVSNLNIAFWTTPLLWGTRWPIWDQPLKYLPIEELSEAHIHNILKTQSPVPPVEKLLQAELIKRK